MDRAELLKRRDELRDRLAAIRRDLGGGLERDLEEQSLQLENQDALLEIARVTEDALHQVEHQLDELDSGNRD